MNKRIFTCVMFCLVPNLSHARWYNPQTGQWVTVDPTFDFPTNYGSPYGYAGRNPINIFDKSGRFSTLEVQVVQSIVSELIQFNLDSSLTGLQDAGGIVAVADNRQFLTDVLATLETAQKINQGVQIASAGFAIGSIAKAGLTKAGRVTLGKLRRTFGKPKTRAALQSMIQPGSRRVIGGLFNDVDIPLKRVNGRAYRSAPPGNFSANYLDAGEAARFKSRTTGTGYFSLDSAETSAFEVASHGASQIQISAVNVQYDNVLDLTDPDVWNKLPSHFQQQVLDTSGNYKATMDFADFLQSKGVNGVIYPSVRNPGGVNLAVFARQGATLDGSIHMIDIDALR